MNPVTNFIFSTNLSLLLLYPRASMTEILVFNLVFAAGLDMDRLLAKLLYKPQDRLRTWLKEPAGFFVVVLPVALVMSTVKAVYFGLTVLPYVVHLLLDYISVNRLRPFAPFHDFEIVQKGMAFLSWPREVWQKEEYGVSELYFLAISLLALAYTWVNLV